LTERELDVLRRLHQGEANKEIARTLGIQETTVKLHLRSLSTKLDARNRTEIVIKSLKGNFL
jgi:DNA-binding NarL/FixJ family response regulator